MSLPSVRVAAICLLLVGSTVVWRRGEIFSGGLDPVVVGKGLLSVLALGLAFFSAAQARGGPERRLGTGTWWFLATMLTASVLGALGHGTLTASGVIAVRVAIVAATVFFALRAVAAFELLTGMVWACGVIAAVAALTGLGSLSDGRLFGGVPPLNPNDLALLAGAVVLWTAWRTVLGEARWRNALLATGYLGVLWVTGSRTGLLMLVLAIGLMTVYLRRARVGLVVGALLLAAAGSVAIFSTGAIEGFVTRDGAGASTLDSRFIAWSAARTWAEASWQVAFGGGLSVKLIPVDGQWWDTQLLDSSWVSALVQSGVVGLGVVLGWVLWVVRGSLRAPRPHRVLFIGLVAFLVGRSILESGLFDATPAFILFVAVSFLAEGGSRHRLVDEAWDDPVSRSEPSGPRSVRAPEPA
ncbi:MULTISPECIES: hypothetical protein [unclassified Modestobacter]